MIHQRVTTIAGKPVKLYSRTGRTDDVWASSLREYDRTKREWKQRIEEQLHPGKKGMNFRQKNFGRPWAST